MGNPISIAQLETAVVNTTLKPCLMIKPYTTPSFGALVESWHDSAAFHAPALVTQHTMAACCPPGSWPACHWAICVGGEPSDAGRRSQDILGRDVLPNTVVLFSVPRTCFSRIGMEMYVNRIYFRIE